MGKCILYFSLIQSLLGVIFGFSGFIVFFFIYHNVVGGTWTLLSGIYAAVCLHLHYLKWSGRITNYHSTDTLEKLACFGVYVCLVSTAFFVWYIFATLYWKIPMLPVQTSSVINAVWSFMTAKWGLMLNISSRKYRRELNDYTYAPLLIST